MLAEFEISGPYRVEDPTASAVKMTSRSQSGISLAVPVPVRIRNSPANTTIRIYHVLVS